MAGLSPEDIAARVKRQFGDEDGSQVTDADIVRWINDAQREISVQHDLMQKKATAATVANQNSYSLPADILRLRSVKFQGITLEGISLEQADELLPANAQSVAQGYPTGTPCSFWVFAGQINLYPAPASTSASDLTIYYTATIVDLAALTGDAPNIITLPPEYHNSILEYCLKQAYELDANTALMQAKGNEFQQGIDRLKANTDWQNQATYPSITVIPEYDSMGLG